EAYRQLIQEFELTQEQVAQKVGKDRTTVSNALRLLKMPDALKDAVLNESISEGHARALMQIPDAAKQEKLLAHVADENLSVRQTEELVRRTLAMTISHRPKTSANEKRETPTRKWNCFARSAAEKLSSSFIQTKSSRRFTINWCIKNCSPANPKKRADVCQSSFFNYFFKFSSRALF
ncbi:MAG: hypothetical protein DCC52_13735, partial [Chloroflexi bacterium]